MPEFNNLDAWIHADSTLLEIEDENFSSIDFKDLSIFSLEQALSQYQNIEKGHLPEGTILYLNSPIRSKDYSLKIGENITNLKIQNLDSNWVKSDSVQQPQFFLSRYPYSYEEDQIYKDGLSSNSVEVDFLPQKYTTYVAISWYSDEEYEAYLGIILKEYI